MKTMNFLFTMVFALLIGACTNETQPEELSSTNLKGSKSQEKEENEEEEEDTQEAAIYFEWDLHLIALAFEIVQIEEEIEISGGNSGSLHLQLERKLTEIERIKRDAEEIFQRWVESGEMDYWLNQTAENEALSQSQQEYLIEFLRRRPIIIGPGGPGFPCGQEGRCNLPLNNATTILVFDKKESSFEATVNGELCGEFTNRGPSVENGRGPSLFSYEGEEGCADRLNVRVLGVDGTPSSYGVPLEQ